MRGDEIQGVFRSLAGAAETAGAALAGIGAILSQMEKDPKLRRAMKHERAFVGARRKDRRRFVLAGRRRRKNGV